ncbi:hypothetical protein NMY22_g17716 [Coprinellus aureogranulatus]|nr:hypothetical protein NMY22_g17716 [Coprinellus aureogranulatus]
MNPKDSTPETVHLSTLAAQAKEIAKLQLDVARHQIQVAVLESHNKNLQIKAAELMKANLDNEKAYALSFGAMKQMSDAADRLSRSVEAIATQATEKQCVEAKLTELASMFSEFHEIITNFSEGHMKEYERLAEQQEETEKKFKDSLKKHEVKIVFVNSMDSKLVRYLSVAFVWCISCQMILTDKDERIQELERWVVSTKEKWARMREKTKNLEAANKTLETMLQEIILENERLQQGRAERQGETKLADQPPPHIDPIPDEAGTVPDSPKEIVFQQDIVRQLLGRIDELRSIVEALDGACE